MAPLTLRKGLTLRIITLAGLALMARESFADNQPVEYSPPLLSIQGVGSVRPTIDQIFAPLRNDALDAAIKSNASNCWGPGPGLKISRQHLSNYLAWISALASYVMSNQGPSLPDGVIAARNAASAAAGNLACYAHDWKAIPQNSKDVESQKAIVDRDKLIGMRLTQELVTASDTVLANFIGKNSSVRHAAANYLLHGPLTPSCLNTP